MMLPLISNESNPTRSTQPYVLVLFSVMGSLLVANFGSLIHEALVRTHSSPLALDDFGGEKADLDLVMVGSEAEEEEEEPVTILERIGRGVFLFMRVVCCFLAGYAIGLGIGEFLLSAGVREQKFSLTSLSLYPTETRSYTFLVPAVLELLSIFLPTLVLLSLLSAFPKEADFLIIVTDTSQ